MIINSTLFLKIHDYRGEVKNYLQEFNPISVGCEITFCYFFLFSVFFAGKIGRYDLWSFSQASRWLYIVSTTRMVTEWKQTQFIRVLRKYIILYLHTSGLWWKQIPATETKKKINETETIMYTVGNYTTLCYYLYNIIIMSLQRATWKGSDCTGVQWRWWVGWRGVFVFNRFTRTTAAGA